jgi:hypothetical protein
MASGGVFGTGGAPGNGGTGALDASLAEDDARASGSGGRGGGTNAGDGNGGTGASTTSTMGGAPGGDMGAGGIGSGGIGSGGMVSGGIDSGDVDGSLGTGGRPTSILQVVPRNNDIPGWTIDPNSPATAGQIAAVATNQTEAENLIDGAAEVFFAGPTKPKTFAWQNYVSPQPPRTGVGDSSSLMLFIFEMPSAEQAVSLYLSLMQASPYAGGLGWTEPTSPPIGVRSRIADTGTEWWICFCKGSYYVEVRMTPSYGPAPDYVPSDPAQKKAAMDFAIALASRI